MKCKTMDEIVSYAVRYILYLIAGYYLFTTNTIIIKKSVENRTDDRDYGWLCGFFIV